MNKQRREKLDKAYAIIEEVLEEETEAHGNLPESLQYAESGEKMQGYIDSLENVKTEIEEILNV